MHSRMQPLGLGSDSQRNQQKKTKSRTNLGNLGKNHLANNLASENRGEKVWKAS